MSDVTIEVGHLRTPIGGVEVAVRDGRLCALAFDDGWERAVHALERRFRNPDVRLAVDPGGAVGALRRYFDGDLGAVDRLDVDVDGTPFQRRVWEALRAVPAGETASYADIAERTTSPRAVRAVGTATGANRVGIVIPCHRIVRTGGDLGAYGGGVERKRWLLDHERRHA